MIKIQVFQIQNPSSQNKLFRFSEMGKKLIKPVQAARQPG